MTDEKLVQVVCDKDDSNKDLIAHQLNLVREAVGMDMLVGISCYDEFEDRDVTVIAVMTKDDGGELLQYAPIGIMYHPDHEIFVHITPKVTGAIQVETSDVKH